MKKTTVQSYLDQSGRFVIEDYNQAKPFSNFFPGIAGLWGIPMWVFYVNRGQCISSFGIESKDKAILEFQPANKAYRLTSLQGFRTFLKIKTGKKNIFYEPFQNNLDSARHKISQRMFITSHDLTLEEENTTLGLTIRVNYFTLPEEPHAALIRRLTIVNHSRKNQNIELLDGLPIIIPYGTNEWALKNMSRTVEAWMNVNNLKKRAPYYHLKVVVSDRPVVEHIKEGNFYFAFENGAKKGKLLEPIVDSSSVFGASSDFTCPQEFLKNESYQVPQEQFVLNRTPSAMSFARFSLGAGKEKEIVSLTGYARDEEDLNRFVKKVVQKGFVDRKAVRNEEILQGIKNFALTNSSSEDFNQYTQQTFLDNILRGGLPVSLKTSDGNIAFNVFSRKHGDPERDYNYFVLSPTYLSQGNGNYRDVNQNRRNDVWFNADVKDNNVINFLNLTQADGYNPLIVKGMLFAAVDLKNIEEVVKECVKGEDEGKLRKMIQNGFAPGELLKLVTSKGFKLKGSPQEFLARVLNFCHKNETAEHGEGFWTDHWTYNLDLLESYLALYPEELENLLFNKKVFSFYHSAHYILPRGERYILTPQGVRQYHSVKDAKEIKTVHKDHKLRTKLGCGPVYYTHLIEKLLCIIANKAASFDASGVGIEMEADKPNWYDALNGLPGLLGSSISETIELKRLCQFLLKALDEAGCEDEREVFLFEELAHFVTGLKDVLASDSDDFTYWQKANDFKEQYRQSIRLGLDGKEVEIFVKDVREWLMDIVQKTDVSIEKAKTQDGLLATYFTHEVEQYELSDKKNSDGQNFVWPLSFKRHPLPLYLEGFVHALRVEEDEQKARVLYTSVRQSPLFDRKLKMYKVNASLKSESEEIGRCRIFPSGWLENESIWLHMEYKYLLEVLRRGLYEEFYNDFKNVLIPFMDSGRYGRSTLENSSFIVSSAHEDKSLHGQGFVARLSGSTAEFLHMWLLMNVGSRPFQVSADGKLELTFRPSLAAWLFTKEESRFNGIDSKYKRTSIRLPADTYAFMFLGSTLVVYHNPKRKNTFGKDSCSVKEIHVSFLGKKPLVIKSSTITGSAAQDIRQRKAERIDIFLD